MRIILLISSLFFTSLAWGDLEHRHGQGERPSAQKLSLSRGCFKEINDLGCGHPAEDHEVFISCLDEGREKLSNSCQIFFERLYGRRN